MTKAEIFTTRKALQVLASSGPAGIGSEALIEQVGIMTEKPLTTAEGRALLDYLLERQWAETFRDPITQNVRYVLTGPGELARGAL